MMILAVDPGATTGWSLSLNGRIVACGIGTPPFTRTGIDRVVIELPQYRPHDRKDPNMLIALAIWVGRYVESAARIRVVAELITPVAWKGSVPKDIHNARVRAKLDPEEQAIVAAVKCAKGLVNNMIDAIGINLNAMGRRA